MAFEWSKFLTIAENLSKNSSEEYIRSSISRAYYSVFNILRLKAEQNTRREQESHIVLIETLKDLKNDIELKEGFKHLEDEEIRSIGHDLKDFRDLRNRADYDGISNISQQDATEICEKVKFIFKLLNSD